MAYTVLARKYRSQTFDEVIGQAPIATTLVNAIKAKRIHHGYLFTGTRGVGKTSMARILAKALNCLKAKAPTVKPCCKCDACVAIAEGQDIDVVEIDAASNTGVDNIRELRSNTAYRPARARFKIYIIDEVHMLSTGAFNALLKTLEEPPAHVKFVLATTELQKVPATIQSRCQRFNFRHIGAEAIGERLAAIAQEEGAETEPAVVRRIARLANGSMRDALSILDQLLSVSPKKLTVKVLDEILPPAQDEQVFALLKNAAQGGVAAVLTGVEDILAAGRGLEVFCNDMIEVARALMLLRACGPEAPMVDVPAGARDEYVSLSDEFELSQYVQMIAMLEELRRNVRFSGAGRALTDALMIRLAHMREWTAIEDLLARMPAATTGVGEKKKPVAPLRPPPASDTRSSPPDTREPHPVPRAVTPPPVPTSHPTPVAESVADYEDDDTEIPAEYSPPEARQESPVRSLPAAAVTSQERAQIMKDPVVQRTMELFDGVIVDIQRRPAAPAANATE
ncbi:MAG: DNA polymerase III subunit gamma/tau [Planctomycetes bacterium]|nr:DNA polymerase III subunit gamma/tau [Planctomycetota bacterium]